ncbi:MAG: Electron transfer flavoprotein subunit alpha [Alphaproteobacteria bacterium ADurb.BinA305]|nr:MAG: Electron transfer flavoprotein subunit alpha [Alphaproteobacteria bacterium ADurb.BinA305]
MNTDQFYTFLSTTGVEIAIKVLAALAFWIIGRWLIGRVVALLQAAMSRNAIDSTLTKYVGSIVAVALNIALVLGILGYFGIQTTSVAAMLAGAGVAIGVAWSGLLAHFAAGAFLLVLRPFKVGEFISAGGVTGTVQEIGLFATTILTPDNVKTVVGNNKIFSDNIHNYSTNPVRRVEATADSSAIRQKPEPPFQEAKQAVDLSQASRIVAVGRGIKEQSKLALVEELARALGAEIAASRPICDAGWLPLERQVGSSGQTVSPKLYLALGISGAIQHAVGMKGSRTIVAINKDAEAPIFELADYGIVGDLFEVVPELVKELGKSK